MNSKAELFPAALVHLRILSELSTETPQTKQINFRNSPNFFYLFRSVVFFHDINSY